MLKSETHNVSFISHNFILCLEKQTRNGYIIINHNSFIDIIITLETLSGLLLPDGSSILERLFKIEDLVSALQMRSFMFLSKHARRVVRLVQLSRWIVVREWLILMTNITKMNCFKVKSRDFDLENDIDSVLSLDDMTGMLHMCRNVYYYEMLLYVIFFFLLHACVHKFFIHTNTI